MTESQGYLKTPPAYEVPAWERELRVRLATMCMAVVGGKEGELKLATDEVVEFVYDHAAQIANA